MRRIGILILLITSLLQAPVLANAEQNRALSLSENSLNNLLMDLRMAKEDLNRSQKLHPINMFDYKRMDGDLVLMINQLEQFLFPRVKVKESAVVVTLDGRYFKEALEENNIITPLPSTRTMEVVNIDDLAPPPETPDMLTEKDMQHLNDITNKNTVVVIHDRKEVNNETIKEIPVEVPVVVEKEKATDTRPASAEGVIYAWERNYNEKALEDMMKLYSEAFRGSKENFDARRKDFAKEFVAYKDARIRTYNISASMNTSTLEPVWTVHFDAEISGKQWVEYTHGRFVLDNDLNITDEQWTASVPVAPDSK